SRYDFYCALYRAGGDQTFIDSLERPPRLISRELSTITNLGVTTLIPPAGDGNVIGDSHTVVSGPSLSFDWKVYRLSLLLEKLREGRGQLLSLSNDLLVIQINDEIRIEKMTGELVGSFAVPPPRNCVPHALLLTSKRLYLKGCGPGTIRTF